jgi:glycosyltransferase involved in cell wall biosynthesis
MFICGEELGDLSSKLFAEGMKCGSVYFGNNSNHYEDLGMVDGIHYVKISNNIDEIYDKIIYYQKNISLLEKIAINGKNLVDEKFNTKKIIDLLEGYLKKL